MRISHLIQTIHPDLQILTSVLEGGSFSKKKQQQQQQQKLLNEAYIISFFTDWCGNGPAGQFLQMKNALRTIILKVNLD